MDNSDEVFKYELYELLKRYQEHFNLEHNQIIELSEEFYEKLKDSD